MFFGQGKRVDRYAYDAQMERFKLGDYLQHIEDAPGQAHKVVEIFSHDRRVILLWPNGNRELYDTNYLVRASRNQRRKKVRK